MAKSILLVGQGSHLARSVLQTKNEPISIDSVSHDVDWNAFDLSKYDAVLNMAYDPLYMSAEYDETRDFDLFVARKACLAGCHFVMMSTRRVYGLMTEAPLTEESIPSPHDHYGKNKLRTENEVRNLMGDRCTILRIANVFDFEPGRHTFFGIALKNLRQFNRITLDVSPFVQRDFIPIAEFAKILRRVLTVCPPGIFNLGSGRSTEVGKVALWLIEGYGKGELLVASTEQRDGFELDRSKLMTCLGSFASAPDIKSECLKIGSRLLHE